jgi:transcriptional regulator with XRE-family HTH domain
LPSTNGVNEGVSVVDYDEARKRRKYLEISQPELAARISAALREDGIDQRVDFTALSRWESGDREPDIRQTIAWAKALGLRPLDLDPDLKQVAAALLAPAPVGQDSPTEPSGRVA